jgi:hypothetical protein
MPQMKNINVLVLTVLAITCNAQTKEEREVLEEGNRLYKTEMASWYGTDLFMEKFKAKAQAIAGYFSYIEGDNAICVFYSQGNVPKAIASFKFDSTYNLKKARIDDRERDLTSKEMDLVKLRTAAIAEYERDTFFISYHDMNPNLIPLNDEKGKRVYILTGPQQPGVVVFGNDYLITYDSANNIKEKKGLHKNLIPVDYQSKDGKAIVATIHSHLPETGELITATDICTLKLYWKFTKWKHHIVMSDKKVSLWDCESGSLVVVAREEFEKAPAMKWFAKPRR